MFLTARCVNCFQGISRIIQNRFAVFRGICKANLILSKANKLKITTTNSFSMDERIELLLGTEREMRFHFYYVLFMRQSCKIMRFNIEMKTKNCYTVFITTKGAAVMVVQLNKLWKTLVDSYMIKAELCKTAVLAPNTMIK